MSLHYNYDRCYGTTQATCQSCQRRDPGREQWQSYVAPAIRLNGECSNYIEPQPTFLANNTVSRRLGKTT